MIIMMGLQRHLHLSRRSREVRTRQGQRDESDDEDDASEGIFFSDIIAALMDDEEEYDELFSS